MIAPARLRVIVCALILSVSAAATSSCTLARGYFHQVTLLKGQVVGLRIHISGTFPWMRYLFARSHAKLKLYEYRFPTKDNYPTHSLNELPLVKEVDADENGSFDFGPLKIGHYTLIIDGTEWFDVEVTPLEHATESVLIDATPYGRDCGGGHEFIVKTK